MKKSALIATALIFTLLLGGCAGNKKYHFSDLKTEEYVTLGAYKNLPTTQEVAPVTDYDVQVALNNKLSKAGYCKEAMDTTNGFDGPVQMGDTLNIDFKGLLNDVAFEGGTAQGYSLTIGSGAFIDGFEEKLIGAEVGKTVRLDLTFPADYGKAALAGKDVVFEVKVNMITSRRTYDELTDKIAQELDKTVSTKEELLKKIRADLESTNIEALETNLRIERWNTAYNNAKFTKDIPDAYVAIYRDYYDIQLLAQVQGSNFKSIQDAIDKNQFTQADYEDDRNSYAKEISKMYVFCYAVANAEGYKVTDAIYASKLAEQAKASGFSSNEEYLEVLGEHAEELIRNEIVSEYVYNLIIAGE